MIARLLHLNNHMRDAFLDLYGLGIGAGIGVALVPEGKLIPEVM